jgi:hypothetical protein
MLLNPLPILATAAEKCVEEGNPIAIALADGIAHTDIGLTTATVILAIVTWNLIDDRKQDRIRHHMTAILPWKHMHAEQDSVTDNATTGDHTESHTEIDVDRE